MMSAHCANGRNSAVMQGARGFTMIELILVVVLVSVVAVVGIDRLLYYQERAEKAAMDATLASFKMGLQIHSAELAIANQLSDVATLERENPVRWLDAPPPNYGGEYRSPGEPGNWYFAPKQAELVYVAKNNSYLRLPGETNELRFKVRLRYDDIQIADGKNRVPVGISIVAVTPYNWF
jgi:general secretion pathway protein G